MGGGGQQPLRSFIITHERAHTHKKKARGFFIGRFAAALRVAARCSPPRLRHGLRRHHQPRHLGRRLLGTLLRERQSLAHLEVVGDEALPRG